MTAVNLRSAIDYYRHMRRLSQRDLAKQIGVSAMILSRFERGHEVEGGTITKILLWLLK